MEQKSIFYQHFWQVLLDFFLFPSSNINRSLVVRLLVIDALLVRVIVIKEASKRELKESMKRLPSPVHKLVTAHRVAGIVQLLRIYRIKVGRVSRMLDLGDVGRLLRPQILPKINRIEERMRLHLVRILAQPSIGRAAQLQYQICRVTA